MDTSDRASDVSSDLAAANLKEELVLLETLAKSLKGSSSALAVAESASLATKIAQVQKQLHLHKPLKVRAKTLRNQVKWKLANMETATAWLAAKNLECAEAKEEYLSSKAEHDAVVCELQEVHALIEADDVPAAQPMLPAEPKAVLGAMHELIVMQKSSMCITVQTKMLQALNEMAALLTPVSTISDALDAPVRELNAPKASAGSHGGSCSAAVAPAYVPPTYQLALAHGPSQEIPLQAADVMTTTDPYFVASQELPSESFAPVRGRSSHPRQAPYGESVFLAANVDQGTQQVPPASLETINLIEDTAPVDALASSALHCSPKRASSMGPVATRVEQIEKRSRSPNGTARIP